MPTATFETTTAEQLLAPADKIIALLPPPNYETNYQPMWPNDTDVIEAVRELQQTEAVTTPRQVDAMQARLTSIATGERLQKIAMPGRCADRLKNLQVSNLDELRKMTLAMAGDVLLQRKIVLTELGEESAFHATRAFNFSKPRTLATETHPSGHSVASWQGDNVNDKDIDNRTPDPSRMVSAALQNRDVMTALTELADEHIPSAHEMLLLPYEIGMLREDPETGKLYSLSADMLWIGVRTNDPNGAHINLAAKITNPIGVKLGPSTTPEQVAALKAKLNPNSIPGKLTFMIRMGSDNIAKMDEALAVIAERAPESIILYDPHGSTKKIDGMKIRSVPNVIDEIQMLARVSHAYKLPLHGVILETTSDISRHECIDIVGEVPRHLPDVDPLLNPMQLRRILGRASPVLGRQALGATA